MWGLPGGMGKDENREELQDLLPLFQSKHVSLGTLTHFTGVVRHRHLPEDTCKLALLKTLLF